VVPALLALVGLAVLVGLGSWQLARKAWKEALIARIAERTKAAPVPLADALRRWREGGDVEYLRVRVSGRFRHNAERHVFAVDNRLGPGFHIYTPLETPDREAVLVNRGFVPAPLKEAATRPDGQMSGAATVTGLVRRPSRPSWFAPPSVPARNLFYWRDYEAMIAVLRDPTAAPLEPAPFFLDAEADPPNVGGFPKGGVTRLELPNRHLGYALTWYGLALTLIAVFAAFAVGRLRPADPSMH
jgi:surfeit locus 1 family protein